MNTLIDTSAWIAFLRTGAEKNLALSAALEAGTAQLCAVTWTELWSGARGQREEKILKDIREACAWLQIDDLVWERTTMLMRQSIQKGWVCPLADAIIVACAQRHQSQLLHQDKHMEFLLQF